MDADGVHALEEWVEVPHSQLTGALGLVGSFFLGGAWSIKSGVNGRSWRSWAVWVVGRRPVVWLVGRSGSAPARSTRARGGEEWASLALTIGCAVLVSWPVSVQRLTDTTARTCPSVSMFRTSELSDPRACGLPAPFFPRPRTLVYLVTGSIQGDSGGQTSTEQFSIAIGVQSRIQSPAERPLRAHAAARISHAASPRHVTAAMMSTRSQVIPHRDLSCAALWVEACLRSPRGREKKTADRTHSDARPCP